MSVQSLASSDFSLIVFGHLRNTVSLSFTRR
jgi:hypothetical protein